MEPNGWRRLWIYERKTGALQRFPFEGLTFWEAAWCGDDGVIAVASDDPREGDATVSLDGDFWAGVRLTEPVLKRQTFFRNGLACLLATVPRFPGQCQQPEMVFFQLERTNDSFAPRSRFGREVRGCVGDYSLGHGSSGEFRFEPGVRFFAYS